MAYPAESRGGALASKSGHASLSVKERVRLPQLQPHVNKRAQQLISAHLRSTTAASSSSSAAAVPLAATGVLSQLDSTSNRTSRTHDISHLCDQPRSLAPSIAPSMLDEEDYVFEASFLPVDASSVYSEEDGLWHTKVFPSDAPSSRTDAVKLDEWITRSLAEYQNTAACSAKEELARAIEDLVPILSIALHEMARQVTHHTAERGFALEKIWRTYVELFHRVLRQVQESLREQKTQTSELQGELHTARKELKKVKEAHPEQMRRVISELETQFTTRQEEVEDELKESERENLQLKQDMRNHHRELELWFPGFHYYQESYIKNHIPQHSRPTGKRPTGRNNTQKLRLSILSNTSENAGTEKEPVITPEVAVAQDFKRLLAVLPPEKRKAIGQELSAVLDPQTLAQQAKATKGSDRRRSSANRQAERDPHQAADEAEQIEALRNEVRRQEERIAMLRSEIAKLEGKEKPAPVDKTADIENDELEKAVRVHRNSVESVPEGEFDAEDDEDASGAESQELDEEEDETTKINTAEIIQAAFQTPMLARRASGGDAGADASAAAGAK